MFVIAVLLDLTITQQYCDKRLGLDSVSVSKSSEEASAGNNDVISYPTSP